MSVGELLVRVLLLFRQLLDARPGVGELLVRVLLLLRQLLGVPLGAGQLLVLLLLLLLQPVLLRLLQALAHLGGGENHRPASPCQDRFAVERSAADGSDFAARVGFVGSAGLSSASSVSSGAAGGLDAAAVSLS